MGAVDRVRRRLGFSNGFWPWTAYGVLTVPIIGFTVAAVIEARRSGSAGWVAGAAALVLLLIGAHVLAIVFGIPHVHHYSSTGPTQHVCRTCSAERRHTNAGWRQPVFSPVGHPSKLDVVDGWTTCTRCHVPYPADQFGNPVRCSGHYG